MRLELCSIKMKKKKGEREAKEKKNPETSSEGN